jgi:hypothetical protein
MTSSTNSGTFSTHRISRFSDTVETAPVVDPLPKEDSDKTGPTRETGAKVNRTDKGDVLAMDRTETGPKGISVAIERAAEDRKALAREIGDAAKRAISSYGSVKLATAIQLLRRSLSKAHQVIGERKSEADFLSIVVLAETAISGKKWNEMGKDIFQKIKDAAAIGETQSRVTYDDFNRVFRVLNATDSISGPALNFDDTDDENG